MDNYVNDETKEKMQDIAEKLFILLHGYSSFVILLRVKFFKITLSNY